VIAFTSPYLWYTARATGTVSLVLLTGTIVLGTLVATRVGGNAVGRFELNEVHRSISMIAMVFVAIHVVVTVIDSYVPVGYFALVIPFASSYRRLPVAIGTIAIDLMLAVWISSVVKERIQHRSWRFIHWLSWLCFASAALHGFLSGTDAYRPWSILVTVICCTLVLASAWWRIAMRPERAAGRTAHSPLKSAARGSRTSSSASPPFAPPREPKVGPWS
jgi:sulfoxide reductase heme-binding subunit YedZ